MTGVDLEHARRYLEVLHAGVPADLDAVASMVGPGTSWGPTAWRAIPDELDQLAADAVRLRTNVFTNVHAMRRGVAAGSRGTGDDVVAAVGFVADFDYAVPGHKGDQPRPADLDAALEIITTAGLPDPTMLVDSGGGAHGYWLADRADSGERFNVAAVGFHRRLSAAAEDLGYGKLDNVADRARVLRVPGTVRHKDDTDPVPARLLVDDGPRYTWDELCDLGTARCSTDPDGKPDGKPPRRPSIELDGPRDGVHTDRLAGLIVGEWDRRLAELRTGSYQSGNYIKLRDLAVWAGAREEWIADLRAALLEVARAGGIESHRGTSVVEKLIDSGVELGRADPYKPAPLRNRPTTPETGSAGSDSRSRAADADGLIRPAVQVNGRQLRDLEHDIIDGLRALNDARPQVFNRASELVAVTRDGTVRVLADAGLASVVSQAGDFFQVHPKNGATPALPPRDAMRSILSRVPTLGLPELDAVTSTPIMRPDGSITGTPGYDPATRTFYAPLDGELIRWIDQPNGEDLARARAELLAPWDEFPFVDDASKANAFALLLTAVLRPAIPGPVPLCVVTASTPGTGKGRLTETLLAVATGRVVDSSPWPDSEDERKKVLTAALRNDGQAVVFDNVDNSIRSGILSSVLTARRWNDRVLGTSTTVSLPVRATFAATGNGMVLRGDLTRRAYWVHLEAGVARPWLRDGFRHPNLQQHVLGRRPQLLSAVFTVARAWQLAGRPQPSSPILGSFEEWRHVVGGVLEVAGITGFMGNADAQAEDLDATEWAGFLQTLRDEIGGKFTAADVARNVEERVVSWRDVTPSVIVRKIGRPELAKVIGEAFAQRSGRRWDDDGLRLERVGTNRQKVALWSVVTGEQCDSTDPHTF